jgi:hypothetical protein
MGPRRTVPHTSQTTALPGISAQHMAQLVRAWPDDDPVPAAGPVFPLV